MQTIARREKQTSMPLSLDAEKAFDRLFLEQTLIDMGFGEKFVTWIRLLSKDLRTKVRTNGYCSDLFRVVKGVRQGDSLSPILSAISTEPLAEAIRQNTQIQGIEDERGLIIRQLSLWTTFYLL